MCGILLHVALRLQSPDNSEETRDGKHSSELSWWESSVCEIKARGPDAYAQTQLCLSQCQLSICGSVLALRGDDVVAQPMHSSDGSLQLLWNGEVFGCSLKGFDMSKHDGSQLLNVVEGKLAPLNERESRCAGFRDVLATVEGPYACVLIDLRMEAIYFARDPIGRRSLLIARTDESLTLASVKGQDMTMPLSEVDCGRVWCLALDSLDLSSFEMLPIAVDMGKEVVPATNDVSLLVFKEILSESVRARVQNIRPTQHADDARVAVLFSGGLDCCTLALLVHRHLPADQPIDLLNVAFENPRVLASAKLDKSNAYDVPDRTTGRQSLAELRAVAPSRRWKMVEVNVTHEMYKHHRPRIESLMTPCKSVMDLSIAAALYFAAKANAADYQSDARVLISGLGADELLGGYSRHRKAFEVNGQAGLEKELQMDLDRLPTRNLARDDRIITSHGKECRYPFLDQRAIKYLTSLPTHVKMDLSLAPGVGDKMLLRSLARELGLRQTSSLTKRAIQFGARSAKMDVGDGRIKGHESLTHSATSLSLQP